MYLYQVIVYLTVIVWCSGECDVMFPRINIQKNKVGTKLKSINLRKVGSKKNVSEKNSRGQFNRCPLQSISIIHIHINSMNYMCKTLWALATFALGPYAMYCLP